MSVKVYCDFSNIAHMAYYPALEAHNADPSRYDLVEVFKNNLRLKLQSVSDVLLRTGILDAEFIFVKDEYAVRKILLYPQYKQSHGKSNMPIEEGVQFIKDKGYGRFCSSPDNEADDAIATLVRENGGGVVVSMDKDLWQLIDHKNTLVIDPLNKVFIREQHVYKVFRLQDACHIALYKALWGDAGDCVPNAVPRMQRHLLPVIRSSDGTLDGFSSALTMVWDFLSKRCQVLYSEGQAQVYVNYELVKLDTQCQIVWD